MGWKRVTLGSRQVSAGENMRLQNEFVTLWMSVGAPPAAAMYGDKRIADGNFHFYFTPAAVMLALSLLESFGAADCPEPDVAQLAVHVLSSGAGRTS